MLELSRIAAMAGHGGLFSIHTALKNGVLLESLDDKKTRVVASATSKVSILSEISIYTTTGEGSVSLESVLQKLFARHKGVTGITSKSDGSELRTFLAEVLPDTDFDRVYVSDIKKLANWYNILVVNAPEVLKPQEEPAPETPVKKAKTKPLTDAVAGEGVTKEEKPKKAAPKKTPKAS